MIVWLILSHQMYPSHSLNGGGVEEVGGASEQGQIIADYMAACQNNASWRESGSYQLHPIIGCLFNQL